MFRDLLSIPSAGKPCDLVFTDETIETSPIVQFAFDLYMRPDALHTQSSDIAPNILEIADPRFESDADVSLGRVLLFCRKWGLSIVEALIRRSLPWDRPDLADALFVIAAATNDLHMATCALQSSASEVQPDSFTSKLRDRDLSAFDLEQFRVFPIRWISAFSYAWLVSASPKDFPATFKATVERGV